MGLLHPDQLKDLAAARSVVPAETSRWNLGYLDSLVESHFRRLQNGALNFYPYGPFGRRGFVVRTSEQEVRLRRRARGLGRWSILLCAIVAFIASRFVERIDLVAYLAILAIGWVPDWILSRIAYWSLTRNMTRASEPNSPVDYWRSMGRILHPALLVLFALALLCLSAGGFLVYALEHDPIGLAIGIPSLLLTVPAYSVALVAHIRSGPGTD